MNDNGNHVSQGGYGIIEVEKIDLGNSAEVFQPKRRDELPSLRLHRVEHLQHQRRNPMATEDITIINEENIKGMVYEVRGQRVMLDFDLARIYGYETRDFNNQVKHNAERFESSFCFRLEKNERHEILKWKKSTSSWGGARKLPYAFTEQGVYMQKGIE